MTNNNNGITEGVKIRLKSYIYSLAENLKNPSHELQEIAVDRLEYFYDFIEQQIEKARREMELDVLEHVSTWSSVDSSCQCLTDSITIERVRERIEELKNKSAVTIIEDGYKEEGCTAVKGSISGDDIVINYKKKF